MLELEVAYCLPEKQWLIPVCVAEPCNVKRAIEQSGILQQLSIEDINQLSVGIFSRKVNLDTWLKNGDRIEIYRPLTCDPKTARRKRAAS